MSQFPGFEEIEIKVSTEELLSQLAPKQANAEKYSFQAESVRAHWLAGPVQRLLWLGMERPLSSQQVGRCVFSEQATEKDG